MFERGFKSWCERLSLELRKELGHRPADPLDPHSLANHLGIAVLTTKDFPELSEASRKALEAPDAGWSAVTLDGPSSKLIIVNHTHSIRRQSSDLMHEIAHHLLEHKPSGVEVSQEGLLILETYSRKQEEEADWLAGCLLLPRPALVHIHRRINDHEAAAERYVVSLAMLKYRLDVSGVNYQFRA